MFRKKIIPRNKEQTDRSFRRNSVCVTIRMITEIARVRVKSHKMGMIVLIKAVIELVCSGRESAVNCIVHEKVDKAVRMLVEAGKVYRIGECLYLP
jgi:hypothetical protein